MRAIGFAPRTLAIGVIALAAVLASRPVAGAEDETALELRARTLFATGEYKQALDIYGRLYVQTMHPTYLRNIARCHQNLGDPDKAITSFREYLRKAKDLTPEQRAEIESYIVEMQQLKRSGPGTPATPPPPAPSAPPAAVPPADRAPALVGPPTVVASRAEEPRSEPIYTRAWFWVAAGVVVAAAVTAVVLLSVDRSPTHGGLGVVDLRPPR